MTDFLFARPTLLSGVARTFDLFGTFDGYNESPEGHIADSIASFQDWRAVGDRLREAVRQEMIASQQQAADGGA